MMTRAGREPTEDVKRAFRRAIEFAGLEVCTVQMVKMDEHRGRLVLGGAKPQGWKHELPAVEISALVKFNGEIGLVAIRCGACDDNPIEHVFDAPRLQDCRCDLTDLPQTLKDVWAARGSVLQRWKKGERLPIHDGQWTWKLVDLDTGLPDQ